MSRFTIISREEAEALRMEDVRAYLVSQRWQRDDAASSANAGVFRKLDCEILLPSRRDLGDYALRMADVILTLALAEERPPRQLLADLSLPPAADILRLRQISPTTATGHIPLAQGVRLLDAAVKALLAVAHSVEQPLGYHPRLGVRRATELLARCRLGQTERGSFIATILIPVPPSIGEPPPVFPNAALPDEAYERRVTQTLMCALGNMRGHLDAGRPEQILNSAAAGVSGNLCEALAEMTPADDQSQVEIGMSWARARPILAEGVPVRVRMGSGERTALEELARRFMERQAPAPQQVTGRILALRGDTSQIEGFTGHVTIRFEELRRNVDVILDHEAFNRALESYRNGRTVRVTGILRHSGKSIELLNPGQFEVVEPN